MIIHGDCLNEMMFLDDQSIDMILCDLPYGTTACKWDTIIPFQQLWEAYKRVIKPNGVIVLTAQTPFDKTLGCSNLPWLRYEWIWEKDNATGFLQAKKAPMKKHENVLVFYQKQPTYNPQFWHSKPYKTTNKSLSANYADGVKTKHQGVVNESNGERYPLSILQCKRDFQKLHPTQKPVALFEYLIKTYTNPGDLVLDNCAGSGTTAIAALNTGRRYICIEKEKEYFDLMATRIMMRELELGL